MLIVLGEKGGTGEFRRIGNMEGIVDHVGTVSIGGHSLKDCLKLNIDNFFEMVFII